MCGVEALCLQVLSLLAYWYKSTNTDAPLFPQHYSQPSQGGWFGLHCEGACFRSLFGLLFWDVIFSSSVPDVFLTPFQDAPLDLNTFPDFYVNRKHEILEKVQELKSADPQVSQKKKMRAPSSLTCPLLPLSRLLSAFKSNDATVRACMRP
jgi:hypothetical protein